MRSQQLEVRVREGGLQGPQVDLATLLVSEHLACFRDGLVIHLLPIGDSVYYIIPIMHHESEQLMHMYLLYPMMHSCFHCDSFI